jgi:hypothetical protein
MEFMWPDVFTEGSEDYSQTKEGRRRALADANQGWGICLSGGKPPANFGKGMAAIGEFLGASTEPENISRLTDEFLNEGGGPAHGCS